MTLDKTIPRVNCFNLAGFLSLDVVCYIWDQYILSMKLTSFRCIATFSVAMLMLLREQILRCRNVRALQQVTKGLHKPWRSRKVMVILERNTVIQPL